MGEAYSNPELAPVMEMLLDTGPIVATLDRSDPAHSRSREALFAFSGQLWTTSAVVTEAMHLLKGDFKGPRRLVEFIGASNLRIEECSALPDLEQAVLLMEKYADTPMDFADATLILLADVRKARQICTLDRRGFTTFRSLDGKRFTMVPAG